LAVVGLGHGVCVASPAPQDPCATSQVLLNTGYDHLNQAVLPIGEIDARWTVVEDPSPDTAEPRPATVVQRFPSWAIPESGSQWISGYPTTASAAAGTYVFETKFCLRSAAILPQCVLQIGMRADNACRAYLNGNLIHTGQAFGPPILNIASYSLSPSGILGTNVLRVEVDNIGSNPMGLDLVATVIASPNATAEKPDCCSATGSLQGSKYHDLNGNGQRDFGEPMLPGWQINLHSSGLLVNSVTTDGAGYYSFTNLQPGVYTVSEVQKPSWTQTAPLSGVHTVNLQALQGITRLDFGNQVNCTPAPHSMVGWWDGSAGATAPDRAGLVLDNGTWMGGVPLPTTGYVGGVIGQGLRHDATHWVSVPDRPRLSFAAGVSFSIDLWVKLNAGASVGLQPLVCKIWDQLAANHQLGYAFYLEDGHPALLLGDGGITGTWGLHSYVASNVVVPENEWTLLSVTVDRGREPMITFYVNDAAFPHSAPITTSLSHKIIVDAGLPAPDLRIGKFSDSFLTMLGGTFGTPAISSAVLDGETDEVELFRRALKSEEIERIYFAGPKGKCKATPYSGDDLPWSGGSLVLVGNDAVQWHHLNWPFVIDSTTYQDVHISTNGFLYLSNSSVPPGLPTGFGPSSAMIANLRNGPVRIAPFWADLDLQAANGGGVHVAELSNPDRLVVTWRNAIEVGHSTPKTFQCQLFRGGEILFAYDGAIVAEGANVLVGVSAGAGIADPGASDFSAGDFGSSVIAYENFGPTQPFDLAAHAMPWQPNGLGFDTVAEPIANAAANPTQVVYGSGCYQRHASFYQHFGDAASAAAVLQGNSLTLIPLLDGYVANWVPGGAVAFVPPSPSASVLNVGDDGEAIVMPSLAAFPTPFGIEFAFRVHANGIVSMGAAPQTFPGLLPAWLPNPQGFLGASNIAFWSWHDFNPVEPGSGGVKYEEVGTLAVVTWDNVESHASPETANRSTVQCQLDLATGIVTWVWQHVATNSSSPRGSGYLVGFSPGGYSLDPGSLQLAIASPIVTGPDGGLSLVATSSPIPGSLVTYTTSNVPEYVAGAGLYVGLTMISFNQVSAPGIDLTPYGAPGCSMLIGSFDILFSQVGSSPVQSTTLAIPPSTPSGLQFFVQAAALAPAANSIGIVTSNGVASTVP